MAPAPNAMRTEQKLNSNDKNTKRTVLVLGFWTHQILNSSSTEETLFHPKKSRLHVPRHQGSGHFLSILTCIIVKIAYSELLMPSKNIQYHLKSGERILPPDPKPSQTRLGKVLYMTQNYEKRVKYRKSGPRRTRPNSLDYCQGKVSAGILAFNQ